MNKFVLENNQLYPAPFNNNIKVYCLFVINVNNVKYFLANDTNVLFTFVSDDKSCEQSIKDYINTGITIEYDLLYDDLKYIHTDGSLWYYKEIISDTLPSTIFQYTDLCYGICNDRNIIDLIINQMQ